MPDLKTALETALLKRAHPVLATTINEWDDEEIKQIETKKESSTTTHNPTPTPTPTVTITPTPPRTNVSRELFDLIRSRQGISRNEAMDTLQSRGFKRESVRALLSQMTTGKLLNHDNGLYYAASEEYRPTYGQKAKVVPVASKKITAVKEYVGITSLVKTTPTPEQEPDGWVKTPLKDAWTPESVTDTLTLGQAKAVYAYLSDFFGARK